MNGNKRMPPVNKLLNPLESWVAQRHADPAMIAELEAKRLWSLILKSNARFSMNIISQLIPGQSWIPLMILAKAFYYAHRYAQAADMLSRIRAEVAGTMAPGVDRYIILALTDFRSATLHLDGGRLEDSLLSLGRGFDNLALARTMLSPDDTNTDCAMSFLEALLWYGRAKCSRYLGLSPLAKIEIGMANKALALASMATSLPSRIWGLEELAAVIQLDERRFDARVPQETLVLKQKAIEALEKITVEEAAPLREKANAAYQLGGYCLRIEEVEEARFYADQAIDHWKAIGDERGQAYGTLLEARILYAEGSAEWALVFEQAAEHFNRLSHLRGMGNVAWCQAEAYRAQGQLERSAAYLEQALALQRVVGNPTFCLEILLVLRQIRPEYIVHYDQQIALINGDKSIRDAPEWFSRLYPETDWDADYLAPHVRAGLQTIAPPERGVRVEMAIKDGLSVPPGLNPDSAKHIAESIGPKAFQSVAMSLGATLQTKSPVLFMGLPGTGKQTLARLLSGSVPAKPSEKFRVVQCGNLSEDETMALCRMMEGPSDSDPARLFFRNIDQGSPKLLNATQYYLDCHSDKPEIWLMASTTQTTVPEGIPLGWGGMPRLPALDEHIADDLPFLAEAIRFREIQTTSLPCPPLEASALALLQNMAWPANIRGLAACLRSVWQANSGRASSISADMLLENGFVQQAAGLTEKHHALPHEAGEMAIPNFPTWIEACPRKNKRIGWQFIPTRMARAHFERFEKDHTQAEIAAMLGISTKTLYTLRQEAGWGKGKK